MWSFSLINQDIDRKLLLGFVRLQTPDYLLVRGTLEHRANRDGFNNLEEVER